MKKSLLSIFVFHLCLSACQSGSKDPEKMPAESKRQEKSPALAERHQALEDWTAFYNAMDRNFATDRFVFESSEPLSPEKGNVTGIFDKDFDPVYKDFLVYSPNGENYIDFDSYNWTLDENNVAAFEPDQEINLVNLKKRTVTRIGFRGPSQWVEDAYWKNDSLVVLLENTSSHHPLLTLVHLDKKISETYLYKDSPDFSADYSRTRLRKKGIRTE